jgi:hypothetical protein
MGLRHLVAFIAAFSLLVLGVPAFAGAVTGTKASYIVQLHDPPAAPAAAAAERAGVSFDTEG